MYFLIKAVPFIICCPIIHNNLNLTKIESRPIKGQAFRYRFFIDFEGSLEDLEVKNALLSIKKEALEMKILGTYVPVQ